LNAAVLLCLVAVFGLVDTALGESKSTEVKVRTGANAPQQPIQKAVVQSERTSELRLAAPPTRPAQFPSRTRMAARRVNAQAPNAAPAPIAPPQQAAPVQPDAAQPPQANDPCAAMNQTPLYQLGINIGPTEGELPTNYAETCWNPLNEAAGALAGARCWGPSLYNWDATCLCHRPLYFEEINLERYGYGCCETLQPAASAAHFFATVPMLPYCMAVDYPCECIYTLGHYRPGSCPPWRRHWPPYTNAAAAAEAGALAGLILIFP
jgi:hypothetical protein